MKEIFNIFLKTKEKKPEEEKKLRSKGKIIADYREKNSMVIPELISMGIEVDVKELKVADYIINGVAVERKTVNDFINSMKTGRLVRQLEEMQQYDSRLLIIEGIDEQDLYSDKKKDEDVEYPEEMESAGMHPNSIRGFLLSILLNYKIPLMFTKDQEDTAKFLDVLARKKPREAPLNVAKKFRDKEEQARYILEGFPGIGPKTGKKLIKRFKSVKRVINASEEELRKEIGKRAEDLVRIINQEFRG